MNNTQTRPITTNWTIPLDHAPTATASEVNAAVARLDVGDITPEMLPYLAGAAAELAQLAGITARFSADDAPVTFLRMIAKVALTHPHLTGPHTDKLLWHLQPA